MGNWLDDRYPSFGQVFANERQVMVEADICERVRMGTNSPTEKSGLTETMPGEGKDELRRMALQLARLAEISVTLNSTLDIDQLLQFILDTAISVLACEAASIMLYDERKQGLFFTASTDSTAARLAEIRIPMESSIAGTVFRENRPLVIRDVAEDPRHYDAVSATVGLRVRSLLGVPMSIQERPTGVLEALNKKEGVFGEGDIELLSIIANQAAVAIHNAQLVGELQQANQELSKLDKMKNDFMAVASHELRTPLGIILGYASFLKEEAEGGLSQLVDSVLNAAVRLQTLVEDMTNMSFLVTKDVDLCLEPVEIQKIITKACRRIKSTAEARQDELVMRLEQEAVWVVADPKLEMVFLNVLNNAVRFTPDPGKIGVWMEPTASEVLIRIQDNGIGIPADELERIFDQFYQVEDHMTRRYGGLGLGLSISRAITELHGGRIWAESGGSGQGATFTVALPRYYPPG
jgi:signal transduction histidine kinase